jgi:hypothetical protein
VSTSIPETEPHAVELLNNFLRALAIPDEDQRLQAVLPLMHKSLLTLDGRGFRQPVRDYNYLTAVRSVSSYRVPVEITRVDPNSNSPSESLGKREEGASFRYYIARLPKVGGTGIIHIFFPADGGPPSIAEIHL